MWSTAGIPIDVARLKRFSLNFWGLPSDLDVPRTAGVGCLQLLYQRQAPYP